ncbi:hypothetical protein GCM10022393_07480 [Aquimarina addita]|uniref:Lipocalin/cytosolic fatty-acid binding domain-containing protein n=1 Tax=Aquimarina addita TaxID=870485 RepID=A0ABP7XBT1_9FLAO
MKNTKTLAILMALVISVIFISCENESEISPQQTINNTINDTTEFNALIDEALAEQPREARKAYDSVRTVKYVDLDRYDGRWYEIAKFENPFEADCTCTTADYELIDGQVNVLNSCILSTTGAVNSITGKAIVADPQTNAKLILTLDGIPFPADYWILDLITDDVNEEYQFAVVGGPSRENLFILSRTPKITTFSHKVSVLKLLIRLTLQGYDIRNLKISPQSLDCIYP